MLIQNTVRRGFVGRRHLFLALGGLVFAFALLLAQQGVARADGNCQVSSPQVSGNSVTVSFTCAQGVVYDGGYYGNTITPYRNYNYNYNYLNTGYYNQGYLNTGLCWYCGTGTNYNPYYNNNYYPFYNNNYFNNYYPFYNNWNTPYYNNNYWGGYTPCWNGWTYTC